MKNDISDFMKEESDSTVGIVREYLEKNGIFELSNDEKFVETAKLLSRIPWGESRTIEEFLVSKKYGTCTARHSALQACYDILGFKSHQVTCTFRWGEQSIQYPEQLQKILAEGEWDHTHNYLRVEKDDGTIVDVDITWNPEMKDYGFMTFPQDWDGKTSFYGLKTKQCWDNVDMKKMKIELIESLAPELRERRERFLKQFVQWVHEINGIK